MGKCTIIHILASWFTDVGHAKDVGREADHVTARVDRGHVATDDDARDHVTAAGDHAQGHATGGVSAGQGHVIVAGGRARGQVTESASVKRQKCRWNRLSEM